MQRWNRGNSDEWSFICGYVKVEQSADTRVSMWREAGRYHGRVFKLDLTAEGRAPGAVVDTFSVKDLAEANVMFEKMRAEHLTSSERVI